MDGTGHCIKCDQQDSADNMVGCDSCSAWAHFGCVGVSDSIANSDRSWKCDNCKGDAVSRHSVASSHTSSRSRRAEIQLQLIEEQRELRLKQQAEEDAIRQKRISEEDEMRKRRAAEDERYLREKAELQMIAESSEVGSRKSGPSIRATRDRLQQWLIDHPPVVQSAQIVSEIQQPVTSGPSTSKQSEEPDGKKFGSSLIPQSSSTPRANQPGHVICSAFEIPATITQSTPTPVTTGVSGTIMTPPPDVLTQSYAESSILLMQSPNVPVSVGISSTVSNVVLTTSGSLQLSKTDIPIASTVSSQGNLLTHVTLAPIMATTSFNQSQLNQNVPYKSPSPAMPPPSVPQCAVDIFNISSTNPVTANMSWNISSVHSAPRVTIPHSITNPLYGGELPSLVPPAVNNNSRGVGLTSLEANVPNHNVVYGTGLPSQVSTSVSMQSTYSVAMSQCNPVLQSAGVIPSYPQLYSYPRMSTAVTSNTQSIQGPSTAQIAARQVIPRELPSFSGDPREWPLFYSSFRNSTETCGFTNAENLSRLQRSLKGQALDSVRCRLLIPESVPSVMETLRQLYGRPEILIHTVLQKVRAVSPPKSDNLPSLINFGLAVRDAVDHMIMSNLQDHLCNPMLLQELVEKMPSQLKMQWSVYKRSKSVVNLATFGEFMSEIVQTASDVTIPEIIDDPVVKAKNRDKQKLCLHAHTAIEDQGEAEDQISGKKGCCCCSKLDHVIMNCEEFKELGVDGRWKIVRLKGLCKMCLIPHRRWPCRSGKECGVYGCRIRHHELLHSGNVISSGKPDRITSETSHHNHHTSVPHSLFRYLPVTIHANNRKINIFAFLDDGSSATLIEDNIVAELGITGPVDTLLLSWTGDVTREETNSKRISVSVSGQMGLKQYNLNNVRTVSALKLPPQTLQYEELTNMYPHLKGLPIRSYSNAIPSMIIGVEHARLLTTLKVREGKDHDLIGAKTRLGWCVFGKTSKKADLVERLEFHDDLNNRELHERMRQFFLVEEAVVTRDLTPESELKARKVLEATTKHVGDRYETGLLWRQEDPVVPDSYSMALRRLVSLERKLSKNPELYKSVQEQVTLYEQKGYAHQITEKELKSTKPGKSWYLPLGIVQNPKKPGKIRLIWDAAARAGGMSFNDMLLKGPDMLTSLTDVLMRFRMRNVGVCGDIREMFHQIRIREQDKQFQRFLWRKYPAEAPQIYVMDVATFGATCSPCSAQYIKNMNARVWEKSYPKASEAIINAHYVDDFLDSVDTADEAVELVRDVQYVHQQAGFEIRNFSSNAPEVLDRLGESREPCSKTMNLEKLKHVERVLGLVWQPSLDVFTFDIGGHADIRKLIESEVVPTKRQVLRTIMTLFDPLGFVAHFTVGGKIIMQNVWKSGTNWDECIPEELVYEWRRWGYMLLQLEQVQVPRCFFGGVDGKQLTNMQIHMFVDGSENASACVAYLRIEDGDFVRCALVAAKTKVVPLKPLSIPRMELQAAMIGSRLLDSVCSAMTLPIRQRYLWSDSSTVLSWLRSDSRRYHQYVSCRVGEILTLTNVDEWRYVPSKLNVADDATKWGNGPSFDPTSRWFAGPSFLFLPESQWPVQKQNVYTDEELRPAHLYVHGSVVSQPLLQLNRFSKWERLLRTVAFLLRSVKRFRKEVVSGPLTSEELFQAENRLWKIVQAEVYYEELRILKHNKGNGAENSLQLAKSNSMYKLSPFLDEYGVIKMNSRVVAAASKHLRVAHPIILPKNHYLTLLLVDSYHRRFLHGNNETVCNEMRQKYQISSLRRVIKQVSQNCQYCHVYKAVPKYPMMAPLPTERLTPFIKPFTHTGIDYFGPILVKQGRSLVKRWIVLFTCLTIRAVHLEVAYSLSAHSCILAIRRFVARRGAPQSFMSDNGTNFAGASNILEAQLKKIGEECAVTFTNAQTSWHFNPPSAPHMGGS
ncbi:uncharacterized protein LOC128735844 [Sabethes cyaneus]|uniref:uncharacterized protein LOC128735844 n=1 Tax=Sabethes cyaneus TaxID=53552 RepID=UPI00237E92AA|nr:uncharacterized protein LOC128735844 [Sabethes cyaneus]